MFSAGVICKVTTPEPFIVVTDDYYAMAAYLRGLNDLLPLLLSIAEACLCSASPVSPGSPPEFFD